MVIHRSKKLLRNVLTVFSVVILFGCASSPQFVTLRPSVDLASERIGNGSPVEVVVRDNRGSNVIGYRGGVYENSGQISTGNDVAEAVAQALRGRLAAQGFAVNTAPSANAVRLTVYVDSISYKSQTELMKYDVTVQAKISAEVNAGTETYTGRYQTTENKVYVTAPDTLDNEAQINLALSGTINRIFDDSKIRMMLQSGVGTSRF